MPRVRLFDSGTLRRLGRMLLFLATSFLGFYAWQPQRFDLIEHRPPRPFPPLPISQTGLFDKGARVAVVTAHPDDEAFYLGGTLFRLKESGAQVTLIVLTDGDKGYYPFFDSASLAKTRQEETLRSAAAAGLERVVFLGFSDGRLSFEKAVVRRVAQELQRAEPEIVIANEPCYWTRVSHRDHRIAGEVTQAALEQMAFTGWALWMSTVAPNTFSDVEKTWERAQDLLAVHASQFYGGRLQLIRGIVTQYAIEAGERFGVGYAEAFRAIRYERGKPLP